MSAAGQGTKAASEVPTRQGAKGADVLRWAGLVGILTIAVMRGAIAFAPQTVFDVDPAMDSSLWGGLGPAGSLLLDVLLLLCCMTGLMGQWLNRSRIDCLLLLLAMLPVPMVLWHGSYDAGNMWRGSTMVAGAIACAVLAQLARDQTMRIIAISILAGAVAVVLVRGGMQLAFEHADTVRYFQEHREEIFRMRGWEADSPAARIYERRLMQPDPTGWFTTSNIFASLMAFGAVLWSGLMLAAIRAKMQSGWPAAMALLAIAAGAGLWFSGSKGAMLAAAGGLGVIGILDFGFWILDSRRAQRDPQSTIPSADLQRNPKSKIVPLFLISLPLLAIAAVILRGALLPEDFLGDRSLLFRWHYLIASSRMFIEHWLLGVGADGYQAAYTLFRVPRNPEEVASGHSMFVDWLCAYGIIGFSWIAMIFALLWRAGRNIAGRTDVSADLNPRAVVRNVKFAGMGVVAFGLVPALAIEWPTFDDGTHVLARFIGMFGMIATATVTAGVLANSPNRVGCAAIAAATATLIIHGQIEMTFQQPGSIVWALAVLGIAGARGDDWRATSPGLNSSCVARHSSLALIAAVLILMLAVWLSWRALIPAMRQERLMHSAAAELTPIAEGGATADEGVEHRRRAAEMLESAYDKWPVSALPLDAAAEQLGRAAAHAASPRNLLLEARGLAERAADRHSSRSSITLSINLNAHLGSLAHRENNPVLAAMHWNQAIQLARRLTEMDPHGLSAWKRLGDVLWESKLAGTRELAAEAYRRALEIDRNFELDLLKQLSDRQRATVFERIVLERSAP